MISRTRGIFSSNLWKPKNIHSLEYLKYLYTVLSKNQNITEQNKDVLVEIFRLIAEILIWGDQNDSAVIDFFLEKNILSFFLKYMNQKNGKLICNQLLQTLSIMFENISDNTSIYYLLSNNHINSIICHKFDFTDEEVMGYYISFLKALSMKLNKHTINFFYNEHTNDFALYTEAIKFFNQPESMVRTAVRIITLNVYKVADKPMISYIKEKTAKPYFRNLMWFIGNDIITVDNCIRNDTEQNAFSRLQGLVDGHLDHLHYLNDILCLNVDLLNDILIDSLLNRLFIPLYVYSLTKRRPYTVETDPRPHISYIVALFLLSQVFLIIKHPNVVRPLSKIILTGDLSSCIDNSISLNNISATEEQNDNIQLRERKFEAPIETLSETLDRIKGSPRPRSKELKSRTVEDVPTDLNQKTHNSKAVILDESQTVFNSAPVTPRHRYNSFNCTNDSMNISSETVELISSRSSSVEVIQQEFTLEGKPFLKAIMRSLELDDDKMANDHGTLFALGLVFAICHNQGVDEQLLNSLGFTSKTNTKAQYNKMLIDKLIAIFNSSVKYGSPVRLPTLELACILVEILVCSRDESYLSDEHYAHILTAHEESTLLLRNYYKSEEVFVDMFEDEFLKLKKKPLNVEFLMMDSKILLPPDSHLHKSGDFNKKLPSTDIERARYAIRVFLLLRQLCDRLKIHDSETVKNSSIRTFNANMVSVGEKLDLTHKELVACTIDRSGRLDRRFLVSDDQQIILVEPDSKKVGWGVVTFAGFLQHIKITPVRDDNKILFIEIYNHATAIALKSSTKSVTPILSGRFIFDDHIRCMVARKRLEKGRDKAQELKLQEIALMLDFPTNVALGIKPSLSNSNREYCSGYFGPKDFGVETNSQKRNSIRNSVLTINEYDKEVKSNIPSQRINSTSSLSDFNVENNHFN